jgi:hypothetical protein
MREVLSSEFFLSRSGNFNVVLKISVAVLLKQFVVNRVII